MTTFRAKLLQAILGVVAVTTIASLVIAQRQNSATYLAVVDELFLNQATAFQREQEVRLAAAVRQARRLAMSVRLFAALEANDSDVYKIASDELRLGGFSFFRLLNAAGELIATPPDGRAGLIDLINVRGALLPGPGEAPAEGVELGFVELARDEATAVYRVLASPITNFDTQVGTLILGQRMGSLTGAAGASSTGVHSALWVRGRLMGGELPAALRTTLAAALEQPPTAEQTLDVQGETYRFHRVGLNEKSRYPPAELVSVFSLREFRAQQRSLTVRIALIGAVVLGLAAVLAVALARQLAQPIGELVSATKRIRLGDYMLELPPSSTKEMTVLAESFNDMAAGLALKDRYHSLLRQVTDPEVADELVAGRVKLGGELRDVTVMFCDIRGYTMLTVGRNPEEVIELLNHHMTAMTLIVQAHSGVINQFAGDAIMVLFGAPKSYGDDTERAVRCACAMMRERVRMNRDAHEPLEVGIGLASGLMVAGCIGAESRSDYTVVGERANLAARLSSAALPGQILVDDTTYTRVAHVYPAEKLPPFTLKGFARPVVAFGIRVDPLHAEVVG